MGRAYVKCFYGERPGAGDGRQERVERGKGKLRRFDGLHHRATFYAPEVLRKLRASVNLGKLIR